MQELEVARFESAGDVRIVSLVEDGEDGLEVRERREGPSSLVVYGEDSHSLRVAFLPAAVPGLLDAVGEKGAHSLRGYLEDESHDIVDLMDLCDRRGVAYTFVGFGSSGDVQYRPAL